MKVCGIIAEYNPFHNGHAHIQAEAKKATGADFLIVIMSGDYVQRGEPALLDKHIRTKMALEQGADAVFELPTAFATGSAQYFARGAVSHLDALGVVDFLVFGSESGDLHHLRNHYRDGLLPDSPNNILAAEYCNAISYLNSSIVPYTIPRIGPDYHDTQNTTDTLCSASYLRPFFKTPQTLCEIRNYVPDTVYRQILAYLEHETALYGEDFSDILYYSLLEKQKDGYASYFDVYENLSDKIVAALPSYTDYESFCGHLKTKDIAYTHIQRALLHILLSVTKGDMDGLCKNGYFAYLRLLGFRKESAPLLRAIKEKSKKPVITKLADAYKIIPAENLALLEKDISASHLYSFMAHKKSKAPIRNEYSRELIRI